MQVKHNHSNLWTKHRYSAQALNSAGLQDYIVYCPKHACQSSKVPNKDLDIANWIYTDITNQLVIY